MSEMMQRENRGLGVSAMEENGLSTPEDLKLSDKLAVERTVLAADRTMLAGVRTSLSFIGFGFTIFNVLRYLQEHGPDEMNAAWHAEECRPLHAYGGNRALGCHDDPILPDIAEDGQERERLQEPEFPDGPHHFFAWDNSLGHSIGDIILL